MSVPNRQSARRILLTGSRTWTDTATIRAALAEHWGDGTAVLVTGACPRGADAIAETLWAEQGGHVERHPADWDAHGKRAGILRNADMVALGADLCLAFIRDASPGATHAAHLAERADIPICRYPHPEGKPAMPNTGPSTGLLRYALAAAARGWHIFPLTPRDKRPVRGFTDWERHATTDPDQIRRLWSRAPFNIGIACGPSGLVVLDLDMPKPRQAPPPTWHLPGICDGSAVLTRLCEQAKQDRPDDTFTVLTRRGGAHLYFTAPAGVQLRNTSGALGWLIDTRASGGYVVGPGSYVHLPDGAGGYHVIDSRDPAPLPHWLTARLAPPDPPPAGPTAATLLGQGQRSTRYALAALHSEVQRVKTTAPGGRNHALNTAAFALGQLIGAGLLPRPLAEDALHAAGQAAGLSAWEVLPTVRSGLDAGQRRPRHGAA
ncbi:bifunctional DNA primase/polymerase [Streptosporangium sp. G11]|uniref:bifunctional DNA primase/polymerase n=1 Tax=Streptosporangium sp. G11 TaxID=3436926 RepID=UPI003EB8A57C